MGMDEVPAINRRPTFELSFRDRVDGLDYQLDRVPEGRDQFAEEPAARGSVNGCMTFQASSHR